MSNDPDSNRSSLSTQRNRSTGAWIIGAIVAVVAVGLIWYVSARPDLDNTVTGTTEPPAATSPAPATPSTTPGNTTSPSTNP
jgi:hypothetical protein